MGPYDSCLSFISTKFSLTFHITRGMKNDRLLSVSLLWDFRAIIGLQGSVVQLSHRFDELDEGRFECTFDWDLFIFNYTFTLILITLFCVKVGVRVISFDL